MNATLGLHAGLMLALVASFFALLALPEESAGAEADPLAGLRKEHPRLMLTDDRLRALKALHANDERLQRCVKEVLGQADGLLDADALVYKIPDGVRLLSVSRECLRRVSTLALAYRWTEDRRYADAALRELRAVCAFKDWNPKHFLDTAEMTNAVGLGYDWLYPVLDDETRTALREGILRLGLQPGIQAYRGEKYGFPRVSNNWNQVCNMGLGVGALALAETDPDVAREILKGAVASLPRAMKHYAPDGAWMEGPGYWSYATSYTCYGISALDTALGTDLGTSAYPGFDVSGHFPVYGAGPTGAYLCYADAGMMSRRRPQACLFFLAGKYGRPEYADAEHEVLKGEKASAFHVAWYQPTSGQAWQRDLDRYFDGPVQIALLRSAWDDPEALWIGVKAGFNQVAHGHLDLGNFELEALGVRWAVDLGADNYNLPGYWEGREGGRRWSYYRLNAQSHNVCTLDGKDQLVTGTARFIRWHSAPEAGAAAIDLTKAYADVARAERGVQLLRKDRAILVQDEFVLPAARDLTWGMTTAAEIRVEADGSATLTRDGKQLRARILSPAGARFEVGSAERAKPEAENKGIRRLILPLKGVSGEQRIAILFAPDGIALEATIQPLAEWPGNPVK